MYPITRITELYQVYLVVSLICIIDTDSIMNESLTNTNPISRITNWVSSLFGGKSNEVSPTIDTNSIISTNPTIDTNSIINESPMLDAIPAIDIKPIFSTMPPSPIINPDSISSIMPSSPIIDTNPLSSFTDWVSGLFGDESNEPNILEQQIKTDQNIEGDLTRTELGDEQTLQDIHQDTSISEQNSVKKSNAEFHQTFIFEGDVSDGEAQSIADKVAGAIASIFDNEEADNSSISTAHFNIRNNSGNN